MDKKELLDALNAKFYKVLDPSLQRNEAGIAWYLVGVYDKTGDAMVRQNISFFVENAGEHDESAYWASGEPKPKPAAASSFTGEVTRYIADIIADETIVDGVIERVNNVTEVAIVQAFVMDAGKVVERLLIVTKNETADLQHTQIAQHEVTR